MSARTAVSTRPTYDVVGDHDNGTTPRQTNDGESGQCVHSDPKSTSRHMERSRETPSSARTMSNTGSEEGVRGAPGGKCQTPHHAEDLFGKEKKNECSRRWACVEGTGAVEGKGLDSEHEVRAQNQLPLGPVHVSIHGVLAGGEGEG